MPFITAFFALSVLVSVTDSVVVEKEPMPTLQLVDCSANPDGRWLVVNDDVMGGVSKSEIRATGDGSLLFTGVLSRENNGGFASTRIPLAAMDLSSCELVELRVRGDGRRYQIRLRTDRGFDGMAYRAEFDTVADEWTNVRIPWADFRPTFRGRMLEAAPELDLTRVQQLGFLLSDGPPGFFALEIALVQALCGLPEDPEPRR